jgi:hypothetical protein
MRPRDWRLGFTPLFSYCADDSQFSHAVSLIKVHCFRDLRQDTLIQTFNVF